MQNILKEDPLWPKVLEILKLREMKIPFPQIEQKVRNAFNILGTSGTWENENNKKEEIIIPEIPLFQEKKEEIQVAESLEEHNSEKKEEPILDFRIELTEEQIAERERRRLEILEEERRDREQAERRAQARELRRRESGILHLLSPRPHLRMLFSCFTKLNEKNL